MHLGPECNLFTCSLVPSLSSFLPEMWVCCANFSLELFFIVNTLKLPRNQFLQHGLANSTNMHNPGNKEKTHLQSILECLDNGLYGGKVNRLPLNLFGQFLNFGLLRFVPLLLLMQHYPSEYWLNPLRVSDSNYLCPMLLDL